MSTTDNDIINAIGKNPEKGFRMLVKKYMQPVYWHIRRLVVVHADAQDASQETFIRVYRSISSLRDTKAFATWIYRIATNEAMRIVEARKNADTDIDSHADRRQLCRLFRRRGRQVAKCHTEAAAQTASGVQPSVLQRDGLRRHCESG